LLFAPQDANGGGEEKRALALPWPSPELGGQTLKATPSIRKDIPSLGLCPPGAASNQN